MKKTLLVIFAAAIAFTANAQNSSKNGHQITPESGDWGLAIDVDPMFRFIGNMFNGNLNNSTPSWNFVDNSPVPMTITGFMMKDENTAYRAKVRLGVGSSKMTNLVDDDLDSTGNPTRKVEDSRKISGSNILIGAGLQMMRGKHRVRGFYGAEAALGIMGGKTTYEYGNAMTGTNLSPNSTVESSWDSSMPYATSTSSRTTEMKNGTGIYFGIRGFLGCEYFVAPKVSVAGEFGWGLGILSQGEGETTTQYVDYSGTTPVVRSTSEKSGKSSSFGLDTDSGSMFSSSSGSLRLTFYF